MDLDLIRFEFSTHSTIGRFLINTEYFSWSLEDASRSGPKIPGETCIPVGVYPVILDWSDRFQRLMPHVLEVPNFDGIRIHNGSTDKDTRGCILLGYERATDIIWQSKLAFSAFMQKFTAAFYAGEKIMLTIKDGT